MPVFRISFRVQVEHNKVEFSLVWTPGLNLAETQPMIDVTTCTLTGIDLGVTK